MIILIDGYNLIKQVFSHTKHKLEFYREKLIRILANYLKNRTKTKKIEIILVFDGGFWKHAEREIHNNIVIIYSGNKNSADDWIVSYVSKHYNDELLVITNDLKLRKNCRGANIDFLDVYIFYCLIEKNRKKNNDNLGNNLNVNLRKINEDDSIIDARLDGFSYDNYRNLDDIMSEDYDANNDLKKEDLTLVEFERNLKFSGKNKRLINKIDKL